MEYMPDRDPDVILLRLTHRRADLAHWRAVARRWWAALIGLLNLYGLIIFLGLPGDLEIVVGIATLITAVCLGCWHEGTAKGTTLRRSIEEAERDLLAAQRRAEAEAEAAEDEREAQALAALDKPVPTTTTLLLPMRAGEIDAGHIGSGAFTAIVTARAVPLHYR